MKKQLGVTLLEVLVVLAIVAILAAVAVPSFTETTKRNRLSASANEFLSLLQLARAESLRRGGRVILAPSDGMGNWSNGVHLFADDVRDNTFNASNDEEIRVFDNLGPGVTAALAQGSEGFSFDSRGFVSLLSPTSTATLANGALEVIKLCDDRDGETGRDINILISGSVFISEAMDC